MLAGQQPLPAGGLQLMKTTAVGKMAEHEEQKTHMQMAFGASVLSEVVPLVSLGLFPR